MRKIAFVLMLVVSAALAFVAAKYLPNQLETFDIKDVQPESWPRGALLEEKGGDIALADAPSKKWNSYPASSDENPKEKIHQESESFESDQKPEEEISLPAEKHETPHSSEQNHREEETIEVIPDEASPMTEEADEAEAYAKAKSLLENGKDGEFLLLLERNKKYLNPETKSGEKWLSLLLEHAIEKRDEAQLVVLHQFAPNLFKGNEEASLLLAKAFIDSARDESYRDLRESWKGSERNEAAWLALDADAYLYEGKRMEAIELLKSKTFPGKQDVPRLYRLALLQVAENPKAAFEYLTQAKELDPQNTEILSYRGRILEMAGKPDQAFSEYFAAWYQKPIDPRTVQQLSDFYIRQGRYDRALDILEANIDRIHDSQLLTKALFLGKTVKPLEESHKLEASDPTGNQYVQYLANLRPWEFWDESQFERLSRQQDLNLTEQSAFWLELLSHLRKDDKQEALDLLKNNPFANQSWNPNLELALKSILAYQLYGSLALTSKDIPVSKLEATLRDTLQKKEIGSFIARVNAYAVKSEKDPYVNLLQEDKDLLSGHMAYVAALLETGWSEAALDMFNESAKETAPEWLLVSLTKAYGNNRSISKALEFARRQKEGSELNFTIAELLIRDGQVDPAIKILSEVKDEKGNLRMEAAWLRTLAFLEKGDYARARNEIQLNAGLDQSLKGKELLAKAALLEGKIDLADQMYADIAGESMEAKSYLARRYFENGNIALSKKLTLELLENSPGSDVLRKNLQMIERKEGSAR